MSEILALQEMSREQADLDVVWRSDVSVNCTDSSQYSTLSWWC